jgi:L-ribulose-5-phosphate 3-epimerase
MNLGVRVHDFGKAKLDDFGTLADAMGAKGFSCIQLALQKAIEGLTMKPGYINPGFANYIRKNLDRNNMHIAVLGCYINPIHPDPIERRRHLDSFKDHIRFARDFGASVIGTETGSINPNCSYNPGTYTEEIFSDFIKSIAELVEEAEKFGVFVAIEAVANTNTIDSPERMKRVLDTIQSSNLQVIFDPVNMIDINHLDKQNDTVQKSFDLFGDKIVAFHVKDFVMEGDKKKSVSAGEGVFNPDLFFKLAKQARPWSAMLLENGRPDVFDMTIKYVREKYGKH